VARLKWLDDGIARGEAAVAAFVLLLMIFLAALQALLHNLASGLEMTWANAALTELNWIDQVLQKGTLWLAFLGASLATHADRHIAIDALPRLLPGRLRLLTKAIVSLAAAVTSYFLARVFFSAVRITAMERPLEYEVLGAEGPIHLCDAAVADVAAAELTRPELFCAIRRGLTALGAQTETPVAALQLIVPAMFLVIAVRLTARSIGAFVATARDDAAGEPSQVAKTGRGDKS
jgi:TRAP-type C4-dicarboxylate transport system permease small subunit